MSATAVRPASKSSPRRRGLVREFLGLFLGNLSLIFLPIPAGLSRRQLVGRISSTGALEFYSHPNFVCTSHLIWVGWLAAAGLFYNTQATVQGWVEIPAAALSWSWLVVLAGTILVLGIRFNRVAIGFLTAAAAICILTLSLMEMRLGLEMHQAMFQQTGRLPVNVDWGVPAAVSLVLGLTFASVATWRRMNDRWLLQEFGNYLEHMNFQHKDRSIPKGAKTFVAIHECLIRRYLLFGYGDIEVRSSMGNRLLDRIEGVFFARWHADLIKKRLSMTDARVRLDDQAEEEAEEEVADEA